MSSFCIRIRKSYSHFFSKNTCELDIVLTRTVNILTTNKLVKLTTLWTTGPGIIIRPCLSHEIQDLLFLFISRLICAFMFPFSANFFPHNSQAYGFSPVWILSCFFTFANDVKNFSQYRHWNMYGPIFRAFLSPESVNINSMLILNLTYRSFDILWKDTFHLAFYSKLKYFHLIDHMLSETISLSCFCALFSNIYHKVKCSVLIKISIVNWIFGNFYYKIFFAFLHWFWIIAVLLQCCENFRTLNKWNLSKTYIKTTYPVSFIFSIGLQWTKYNFWYMVCNDKKFCITPWQNFADFLLLSKAQYKKQLSERYRQQSKYWDTLTLCIQGENFSRWHLYIFFLLIP